MIVQKRTEMDYYQEDCLLEIEDYLQSITSVSPKEKEIVISDCHKEPLNESIDEIASKTIDVEGLIVYYFVIHDDDFRFVKMHDYDELYAVMRSRLQNWFIGDLVVFENGKKKNYCVKNEKGKIVHYCLGEREQEEKLEIEWY